MNKDSDFYCPACDSLELANARRELREVNKQKEILGEETVRQAEIIAAQKQIIEGQSVLISLLEETQE